MDQIKNDCWTKTLLKFLSLLASESDAFKQVGDDDDNVVAEFVRSKARKKPVRLPTLITHAHLTYL